MSLICWPLWVKLCWASLRVLKKEKHVYQLQLLLVLITLQAPQMQHIASHPLAHPYSRAATAQQSYIFWQPFLLVCLIATCMQSTSRGPMNLMLAVMLASLEVLAYKMHNRLMLQQDLLTLRLSFTLSSISIPILRLFKASCATNDYTTRQQSCATYCYTHHH